MTKEDLVISRHNYDIIFKSLTETFAEQTLEVFDVNTVPIKWVEKTELPQMEDTWILSSTLQTILTCT
ncbi:hypothetical protein [Desulforamulus reducens]|uniref:hypothetical protein n=1 Tax=Desulforamulus reducens TaxID=59610 RepID=UPI00031E7516|nr:hypothetical protein [Desulforamulus reducens]